MPIDLQYLKVLKSKLGELSDGVKDGIHAVGVHKGLTGACKSEVLYDLEVALEDITVAKGHLVHGEECWCLYTEANWDSILEAVAQAKNYIKERG